MGEQQLVTTRLAELEAVIERGLQTFVDVGTALMEIRDSRLYRETHGTFEDYCRERWGMVRRQADRLIEAAEVTANLRPTGPILPTAERQARPLASFPADTQRQVWQRAVETAPNGKVTARHVEQTVVEYKAELTAARPLPEWAQEDDEEEQWVWRFDPNTQAAYCKYCYDRHSDWEISGDHAEPVWMCKRCEHYSADRFLEISDIAPDDVEEMGSYNSMAIHYSSESPEHYTPQKIIDAALWCMDEIDLDPCSNSHETPNVPAAMHYTAEDDGLAQEWRGRVYMNPPYGREIGAWVSKLVESYMLGDVTHAIALLPARTDTQWFAKLRNYPVCFVTGRLTFVGNDDPAPFPSAVFYLGDDIAQFYYAFSELGDIWQRIEPGMFAE